MPAYLIATVKITDREWIPDYVTTVHNIAARHGGKYLSRSGNITALEGDAPDADVIAVVEFPSVDAARTFVDDPDYRPYAEARIAGTESQLFVIDDTDLTGCIDYLAKP